MHVTFHGATREVTGSFHTITTDVERILLDCGLFQGRRKEAEAKNRVLPVDPAGITNLVLSHAVITSYSIHYTKLYDLGCLADFGFTRKDFDRIIAESGNKYNPVQLEQADFTAILQQLL